MIRNRDYIIESLLIIIYATIIFMIIFTSLNLFIILYKTSSIPSISQLTGYIMIFSILICSSSIIRYLKNRPIKGYYVIQGLALGIKDVGIFIIIFGLILSFINLLSPSELIIGIILTIIGLIIISFSKYIINR